MTAPRRDRLLESIGALAREEQRDGLSDPRWDALAAGQASEEDRAALRALAETSEEMAEAWRVLAPPDEAFTARALEAARAGLAAAPPRADEVLPGGAPSEGAKVVPLAPRRAARWRVGMAGALALAASIALGLSLQRSEGPLPAYEPVFVSGARDVRGDTPEVIRLVPGGALTVAMRPASPVTGAVAARAWILRGMDAIALRAEVEPSSDGAVRVTASRGEGRALAPGEADLVVLVCRPSALPRADATRAADVLGASEDRCRRLRRAVTIEAE